MFNRYLQSALFLWNNCARLRLAFLLVVGAPMISFASKTELRLPLQQSAWVVLSYNKTPSNTVVFGENIASVKVDKSAGPIVHKLDRPENVSGFSVKGKFSGTKAVETGTFDEDSILRIGLVAVGEKTLTGPKRWFAADWVKKLFSLVKEGSGLDKIYFFNLTNRTDLVGKTRVHPKSDLLVETNFAQLSSEGDFEFSKDFDIPVKSAAIWISIDGDDTKSKFETQISEIKLKTLP